MTHIAILVHHDPGSTGGYQLLARNLSTALSAPIINVMKEEYNHYAYDHVIAIDDIAARFLPRKRRCTIYLTTPRRSFYDMYYFSPLYLRPILWAGRVVDNHFFRKTIHNIVCISETVRNRIYKTYQRDAEVIYPAIDTSKYYYRKPEDYWLSVQRVDKWKRVDLQVDAFREMPDEKLVIVGPVNPNFFPNDIPSNVTFTGKIPDWKVRDYYAFCKGFITTSIDEDFGYNAIEAMASGKHVIAPYEGGYIESVNGVGELIHPTKDALIQSIRSYCPDWHDPNKCQSRASLFDIDTFVRRWRNYIKVNI